MSEERTLPSFVVMKNGEPIKAFFEEYAAKNFMYAFLKENKEGPYEMFVKEVPMVDRRKGNRP